MNRIRASTGLLWTGWGLLPQEPPAPLQQDGSHKNKDGNTNKQ